MSVADVSRGKKYIDKKFIMHDTTGGDAGLAQDPGRNPGAFKFSIDVAVIFEVPDDLRGVRPIDEDAYSELIDSDKAAFRYFELAVGAYKGDCGTEPAWDSELMLKPDDKVGLLCMLRHFGLMTCAKSRRHTPMGHRPMDGVPQKGLMVTGL